MRLWMLDIAHCGNGAAEKFANLLTTNPTDIVWNGPITLIDTTADNDEYDDVVVSVGYVDATGEAVIALARSEE
jgi:hypothetical protein